MTPQGNNPGPVTPLDTPSEDPGPGDPATVTHPLGPTGPSEAPPPALSPVATVTALAFWWRFPPGRGFLAQVPPKRSPRPPRLHLPPDPAGMRPQRGFGPALPAPLGWRSLARCPRSDARPLCCPTCVPWQPGGGPWRKGLRSQGVSVPWGEFGASLLGREIQDPYPEPQDLAAARAALGGRDPRELLQQDEEGDTLLHVLCAGRQWALARAAAEALRDLGGLELREHLGKTPLLVAAAAAAPEIVRDLLVLGANPDAADHGGRTALHLAAAYGHPEILQAMMSSGVPVTVEARNFEGQTPLHCAVLAHNASLQGGHSPVGGSGGGSPTPQDRFRCVELLLQMGADSSSQDTKSSLTALHLAVRGGNLALAHLLLRQPGMAPRLVNMKAHGNTPLHMAAALPGTPSQEPLVRLLLAWGADPSARNLEHDLPQSLLPPGAPGDQTLQPLGSLISLENPCQQLGKSYTVHPPVGELSRFTPKLSPAFVGTNQQVKVTWLYFYIFIFLAQKHLGLMAHFLTSRRQGLARAQALAAKVSPKISYKEASVHVSWENFLK
ncbi:NF-kappa-B inhibitor delta-like isoform X4 [Motacilla alba alba]|uniref:NF-kappa-B inhibitor delta-like isoform X4 n=1 Tax=Motacilla alba alba TaxID=1094192 RepID=UPI0018D581D8|nr:NF-kappa-B inhibitor delta-like isoform X4 [Motacilla alba alba]